MNVRLLKDAVLVVARASVRGGIEYRHKNMRNLGADEIFRERREWETIREVYDPNEIKSGHAIRTAIIRGIEGIGVRSEAGFIVPEDRMDDLAAWYEAAQLDAADFNGRAKWSRMTVSYVVFALKASNELAAQMAADELRELLDKIKSAVAEADVPKLRLIVKQLNGWRDIVIDDLRSPLGGVYDAMKEAASIMVATLRETEGDFEAARNAVSTASVDVARFALDELCPEREFVPESTGFSGGVIEE